MEMYKMSWKCTKCPAKTSSVLDIFFEMVKGGNSAPKCLEFTSEYLGTPKLKAPVPGPPAFLDESQFQIFSPKGTYLATIPWYFTQNSVVQKNWSLAQS